MEIEFSDAANSNLTPEQKESLKASLQSQLADTVEGVQAAAKANLKQVSKSKVEIAKTKETEKVITF